MVYTAIVIDDDNDTARIFSEFLVENDFKILGIGHSGKDAVELFEKNRPDLIFLDIMMADGSGFYAIKKILDSGTQVKIIAVTADMRTTTREKLNALKIPIIQKPFTINDIMSVI